VGVSGQRVGLPSSRSFKAISGCRQQLHKWTAKGDILLAASDPRLDFQDQILDTAKSLLIFQDPQKEEDVPPTPMMLDS
jgi:hypothetical protein